MGGFVVTRNVVALVLRKIMRKWYPFITGIPPGHSYRNDKRKMYVLCYCK